MLFERLNKENTRKENMWKKKVISSYGVLLITEENKHRNFVNFVSQVKISRLITKQLLTFKQICHFITCLFNNLWNWPVSLVTPSSKSTERQWGKARKKSLSNFTSVFLPELRTQNCDFNPEISTLSWNLKRIPPMTLLCFGYYLLLDKVTQISLSQWT